jgi:hypothetical protein
VPVGVTVTHFQSLSPALSLSGSLIIAVHASVSHCPVAVTHCLCHSLSLVTLSVPVIHCRSSLSVTVPVIHCHFSLSVSVPVIHCRFSLSLSLSLSFTVASFCLSLSLSLLFTVAPHSQSLSLFILSVTITVIHCHSSLVKPVPFKTHCFLSSTKHLPSTC